MNYRNKKLVESAKYEACVSCGNPNACWAHSNRTLHGKGKGIKSHDLFGAYLCMACHDWFDGRTGKMPPSAVNETKFTWFQMMNEASLIIACEKGYL